MLSVWGRHPSCLHTPVKLAAPPRYNSFLNLNGWESNLPKSDIDYEHIITGVREGFHIVDDLDFSQAEVDNYTSVTNADCKASVEAQIKKELTEGRYSIVAS